jgi:hypothetical protein
MRFTQWYSAHPICTPSRAAMVTGRLPVRNGLCGGKNGNQGVFACDAKYGLPKNETTFGTALKVRRSPPAFAPPRGTIPPIMMTNHYPTLDMRTMIIQTRTIQF